MSLNPPSKPKPPPAGWPPKTPSGPKRFVAGPLLGVAQHLVGHGDLFELRLGHIVTGIGVGMQLAGAGSVGLLDFVVGGFRPDPSIP